MRSPHSKHLEREALQECAMFFSFWAEYSWQDCNRRASKPYLKVYFHTYTGTRFGGSGVGFSCTLLHQLFIDVKPGGLMVQSGQP